MRHWPDQARSKVLWLGDGPQPETERKFAERGLILSVVTTLSPADCRAARGAVFVLPKDAEEAVTGAWFASVEEALCHELKVLILAELVAVPGVNIRLRGKRYGQRLSPWVRSREADVPEEIARYDAGPAWSSSLDVQCDSKLRAEDEVLVRRAFGDCRSVKLVRQPAGRSADVFCAYARLADSRVGPVPLPFFVKLDRYPKIRRELKNYQDCTTAFIPFNQRPNLDLARCALGAERGILVGNFIEESDSLRAVVDRGTARQAIASLFGGALRGWRSQADHDPTNVVSGALAEALPQFLPSSYGVRRREKLAQRMKAAFRNGARLSPEQLEAELKCVRLAHYRRALMHGDLHGENVRVAANEAILIDFNAIATGPLVSDPAALDVALVIGTATLAGDAWRGFAADAYSLRNLRSLPHTADPTTATPATLWNAIRQIRQIGLADAMSELEYASAVAIHLLHYVSHPAEDPEGATRRAYAYVLAERLIQALAQAWTASIAVAIVKPGAAASEPLPAARANG